MNRKKRGKKEKKGETVYKKTERTRGYYAELSRIKYKDEIKIY